MVAALVLVAESESPWQAPRAPVVLEFQRARCLPITGEFVARHARDDAHALAPSEVLVSMAGQEVSAIRSRRRRHARACAALVLDDFMQATRVSNADLAAALDTTKKHVGEMRRGRVPFEIAHVDLLPSAWQVELRARLLMHLRFDLLAALIERLQQLRSEAGR